jgi:FKBP-type peptidyl-prolyl cis-trans isomerase
MKGFKLSLRSIVLFFASASIIAACYSPEKDAPQDVILLPDSLKTQLEEAHQALSEHEEKIINQYITRHELKLDKSATGLRYIVYRKGEGKRPQKGDIVRIHYTIGLINGIEAYSTLNDRPEEIMIEKSEAVSGLHELLQYMTLGSKARAIIPSYLAYGLTGDQDRIPKGATLIMDVELLQIITVNNQ